MYGSSKPHVSLRICAGSPEALLLNNMIKYQNFIRSVFFYFSDEEEEDTDALLYLPVAPDIDEPEEGWPLLSENVS